jgi:hypothetical protein
MDCIDIGQEENVRVSKMKDIKAFALLLGNMTIAVAVNPDSSSAPWVMASGYLIATNFSWASN